MKRFLLFFPALFLLTFAGCGKPTPRKYLNDLSAAELADLADDALSEDFRAADADYLTDYVTLPQAGYSISVRLAAGGDRIDEFCIRTSAQRKPPVSCATISPAPTSRTAPFTIPIFPPRPRNCATRRFAFTATTWSTPSYPRRREPRSSTVWKPA